jgi:hypothetical protein
VGREPRVCCFFEFSSAKKGEREEKRVVDETVTESHSLSSSRVAESSASVISFAPLFFSFLFPPFLHSEKILSRQNDVIVTSQKMFLSPFFSFFPPSSSFLDWQQEKKKKLSLQRTLTDDDV